MKEQWTNGTEIMHENACTPYKNIRSKKVRNKLALRQLQVTKHIVKFRLQTESHDSECVDERVQEQITSIAALN